jgi:hypothetical protein
MEGMYQRKDGGQRSTRRRSAGLKLLREKLPREIACGGSTNVLADAITAIELFHRRRHRGNKGVPKFTKMKPPGPTSITGGKGKERLINCEYCGKSTTV